MVPWKDQLRPPSCRPWPPSWGRCAAPTRQPPPQGVDGAGKPAPEAKAGSDAGDRASPEPAAGGCYRP